MTQYLHSVAGLWLATQNCGLTAEYKLRTVHGMCTTMGGKFHGVM